MQFLHETPIATLIFVLTLVTSLYAFNNQSLYGKFMLHPYTVAKGKKLYTFITSGLIHADGMHLFFNLFTFFFFGFALERTVGSANFAIIYIGSLILSDVPTVFKHKDHFWYNSLGASGAISGILFSYILFYPLSKIGVMFIPMRAALFGPLYLGYCWYMSKNANDNIAHDAHFFGALTGLVLTVILIPGIISHFLGALAGGQ